MTTTALHQSYMTENPSLFTLISYYAIVFSFAFACLKALEGFLWAIEESADWALLLSFCDDSSICSNVH